jgi:cell shape-determining protein MreC
MPALMLVLFVFGLVFLMATVQARRSGRSNIILDTVASVASVVSTGGRDLIDWGDRMKRSLTSGSELLVERDRLVTENGQMKLQIERLSQVEILVSIP